MTAEGWYQDPSGRHEARWFSAGTPTGLVRDGRIEAQDDTSDIDAECEPLSLPEPEPDPGDLRRADEVEAGGSAFDPRHDGMHAVLDGSGSLGIGFR